jgi:hypothetical protein
MYSHIYIVGFHSLPQLIPAQMLFMVSASRPAISVFANIPKLEPDGKNWVIFRARILLATKSLGIEDHLSGKLTAPDPDPDADAAAEYARKENLACFGLADRLLDSLFQQVLHYDTVAEMWETLESDFTSKTALSFKLTCTRSFSLFGAPRKGTCELTWPSCNPWSTILLLAASRFLTRNMSPAD